MVTGGPAFAGLTAGGGFRTQVDLLSLAVQVGGGPGVMVHPPPPLAIVQV